MMQKRKLSSLLLISFIVVFGYSFAVANTVDFGTSDQLRCDGALQEFSIDASQEIVGFEIIAEVSGDYTGMPSVAFGATVPAGWSQFISYRGDGVSPDTIRLAAIRLNASDPVIPAGVTVVATLTIQTADACGGSIAITGGEWTDYINPTGTITTQFIDASTTIYAAAILNGGGAITLVNDEPVLAELLDAEITWNSPGNSFTVTAAGSDDDLANECEEMTYGLSVFPDGMVIDPATGVINWTADGEDVCQHSVTVSVTDACGDTDTEQFSICVSNVGPTVADLDNIIVRPGEVVEGQFVGDDPDGGPTGMLYEIVSFTGEGVMVLDGATGEFSWDVPADMTGQADFTQTLCVSVSDQTPLCVCNLTNADTACVEIEVIPLRYVIEKTHNVLQGGFTTVALGMPNNGLINYEIGGFEFLIQYDASAVSFMGADPGSFVTNCGWEYFTYRVGPFGNCGSACPSGMIKIVGLAETNNGSNHPEANCTNTPGNETIALLKFYVSGDRNLECQYVPIRFTWIDCADNSVSDVPGEHLFWGRRVFNYDGPIDGGTYFAMEHYTEAVGPEGDVFPTIYGPTSECDDIDDSKADVFSYIDFFNGGIDIVCADSIDARGDINLDDIPYTVADAVMFTNYFINGVGALVYIDTNYAGVHVGYAGSVAASDVNGDGLTLTVADLVMMIRVVVGDELPMPKEVVSVDAVVNYDNQGVLSVANDALMGAAYIVFAGEVHPALIADGMDMKSAFDGENTRVLVYSMVGNSFSGDFISANADVVSIELATSESHAVKHALIPSDFDLSQNYPNPFNPTTNIEFNLPAAGDYSLTIYNVTGQVVAEFNGNGEAGVEMIEWDASRNASGVYFYKLTLDGFSATKKMVLLK